MPLFTYFEREKKPLGILMKDAICHVLSTYALIIIQRSLEVDRYIV